MFHDTVVYYADSYDKRSLTRVKVTNGGTSHQDVFEKALELTPKPGMMICFTDLYSDQMMIPNPKFPVVWAVLPDCMGQEIPWGKKIEITDV
jgi:predicted metal-dependent peptidase